MGKDEFLEKARELGYTEEMIAETTAQVEERVELGFPPYWEKELVVLPYN